MADGDVAAMTKSAITPEQLAEWRDLCDASTPGTWRVDECDSTMEALDGDYSVHGIISDASAETNGYVVETDAGFYPPRLKDARFIAAARTAVPALLDEVTRLQEELGHATAHEGDWLSKTSRRMCDLLLGNLDALRGMVKELTAARDELADMLDEMSDEVMDNSDRMVVRRCRAVGAKDRAL